MAEPTYTFRQGDLPKLDLQVDRGTDFSAWKMQWESYCSLLGLEREDAAKQVKALTLCFSRETLSIVQNLGLTEAQRKDAATIIAAIQRYIDGHVNETVERHNFRRRVQMPGESFDDFLISLRELVKTCRFCSETCAQKSIRDQIIEGLSDGDTVEDLLQVSDLTLATTITKCQSREAARKHRTDMVAQGEAIAALRQQQASHQVTSLTCPGCGANRHKGGRAQCPAYDQKCALCRKIGHFARVCRSKRQTNPPTTQASTNAIRIQFPEANHPQLYNIKDKAAPTITVSVKSSAGTKLIRMLPDSGADISAAGQEILHLLGHHADNIQPSGISPRAVNGTTMSPLGKIPVTLQLGGRSCQDDLHIYPGVSGALMSWKTARELAILPKHYPQPIEALCTEKASKEIKVTTTNQNELKIKLMQEFPEVFSGQVALMKGEKFTISLMDKAVPFCVKAPRTVPYAYWEKLREELELLQEQGIIAPVTEVTEWCAPIVVAPKKGSDRIRMCVDLSRLNRYVRRERYQSPTPADAVADLAAEKAKYFTVIDAMKGYHQCPLEEESQALTTFITPFGRYKYLRAPYGLSSIAEHYNRRMAEAFEGLTGFRRIVDDIVIYDQDEASHIDHVRQFLQRCRNQGISLNKDKWQLCQTCVTFAGFQLSRDGYRVDPSLTDAIAEFPIPATRTELRSFFGLVNQLATCTDKIANLLAPLRPLLSTKNEYVWLSDHDQALLQAKQQLVRTPILAFFDLNRPTRLCTDASRTGILQQQSPAGQWSLIQAGSRFLSGAESRYAVIELEMLAVTWAMMKCKIFLAGLQTFQVITDHNPLIPILNSHRLDEIENPRLQRLRHRLMAYNFNAVWCKGTNNKAPDALSRSPVREPQPKELLAEYDEDSVPELSISEIRAVSSEGIESIRLQELRQQALQDNEYQCLRQVIMKGFPDHRSQMPELCRRYWQIRHHLTIDDELIVYGCCLVIPSPIRRTILTELHRGHQGIVQTKQRASLTLYWPGINNDIENMITACKQCQDHIPSNPKEPLQPKPRPSYPFQEVAADFCQHAGRYYLIIVDCYSDWPTIVPMGRDITTSHLVAAVRELISHTAVPDVFWSDGGPQFRSKQFQEFTKQWGFTSSISSPYYPQSNGKAEAAVKSMKKLIRAAWNGRHLDEEALCQALLQYRNTPSRRDGLSSAQKLYGHPVQDTLPAHRRSFAPEWQQRAGQAESLRETSQRVATQYYNRTAPTWAD